MPHVSTARKPHAQSIAAVRLSKWRWLTRIAFVLTLALVACRILMPESIRSPIDPLAGLSAASQSASSQSITLTQAPASPGPATGIALDLLLCIPALLVLLRRVLDPDYRLLHVWSIVPMFALAILAAISTRWAADKFASIISVSHLIAALVCLWSTLQLVRSWRHVRLIAGVSLGLLMCLSLVGYNYRLIEVRDLRDTWEKQKDEILSQHNFKPNSFEAGMFENRVLKGQPMGYSTSTNTYAALLVLTGIIAAGVLIQHASEGRRIGWMILPALAILLIPPLIHWTACRAAYATPVIAALLFLGIFVGRPLLARFSWVLYLLGVAVIGAIGGFVVHHGLEHNSLWHDSLTFRWRYWVGAVHILTAGLKHAPPDVFTYYLGVGWENFGPYYLTNRLAIASEEIRDPHNFIVRAFVELGMVGGYLLIGWMLWLWRDMTRPSVPADSSSLHAAKKIAPAGTTRSVLVIVAIASTAFVINIASAIDFGGDTWYAILELLRRLMFLVFLGAGLFVSAMRTNDTAEFPDAQFTLDDRPAPWMLYAILIALGTFLIHNMIEFSLFEPGPMCLFMFLAGAVLSIRGQGRAETRTPRSWGRVIPAGLLAAGSAGWIVVLLVLAIPVATAETLAQDADGNAFAYARSHNPQALERAVNLMMQAQHTMPINADYARRSAQLLLGAGAAESNPKLVKTMLDAAAAADPSSAKDFVLRAQFEMTRPSDADAGIKDYRRALALDPNNVRLRLEFARQLARLSRELKRPGLAGDAALEFERALDFNEQLAPDEMKRLSPTERADVDRELKELDSHHADTQP